MQPQAGRSAVRIAASEVVTRTRVSVSEPYRRRQVKAWLGGLRAAAEGRAPWPQTVMPATVQRAMAAPAPLRKPMEASAAVVIDGTPGAVWATVSDPVSTRLIDPERVAWAGNVPGTPMREVGEMQCFVDRHPGGRFDASVTMVTELAHGHRAVTRQLGQRCECVHAITPVPGGTRLELTARFSARASRGNAEARQGLETMRADMRRSAEGYRSLIEGPRAPASDAH